MIAPVRWRKRGQLVGYLDAADPVDHISRDLRVLESRASAGWRPVRLCRARDRGPGRKTGGFAGQVVVAQTRSLAVDVLRATGLERKQALGLLPSLPPGPVSYG